MRLTLNDKHDFIDVFQRKAMMQWCKISLYSHKHIPFSGSSSTSHGHGKALHRSACQNKQKSFESENSLLFTFLNQIGHLSVSLSIFFADPTKCLKTWKGFGLTIPVICLFCLLHQMLVLQPQPWSYTCCFLSRDSVPWRCNWQCHWVARKPQSSSMILICTNTKVIEPQKLLVKSSNPRIRSTVGLFAQS